MGEVKGRKDHFALTATKLHGYPPDFRQKPWNFQSFSTNVVVGQVADQSATVVAAETNLDGGTGQLNNFFQNLNPSQYQDLVTLLTSQL